MFVVNLEKSRLDKGLETWPFALDAFGRAYGITLNFDPLFLNAHGRLNHSLSFKRIH